MGNIFKKIIENFTATVGERTNVDEIVRVALFLQKIFGQQVLEPNWSWKNVLMNQLLSILLFIYVIIGTCETFQVTSEAELIAETCYTLIMAGIFPIKLFLFINNRNIFRKLYVSMKTTLLDSIRQWSDLDLVMKKVKRILTMLLIMVCIPVMNHEVIAACNYFRGTSVPLSRTTSILMPMRFPYYEIAWFLHSIFLINISTTVIMDMWFVLLVFFFCAAIESLEKVLEIEERGAEESDVAYGKRLNMRLRTFHIKHVQQAEFLITMNKMYKWLALVPLCNAAMCVCIILLLISKGLNLKFAPHFLPMFAEIFAYNYFGEQIKTKSANLNHALLNFDWTNLQLKDKKSYHIIMIYIQKEFGIKTAMGNDLSLITMTSVLQVTYRAFTMLQSV